MPPPERALFVKLIETLNALTKYINNNIIIYVYTNVYLKYLSCHSNFPTFIKKGPDDLITHTNEFRKAAGSKLGEHALLTGAKALALTGIICLRRRLIGKDLSGISTN